MNKSDQYFVPNDVDQDSTLNDRLHRLHERILIAMPDIDRIACATYDTKDDQLRTFIHSTLTGKALSNYAFKLSQSSSLSRIAATGECRVINEIQYTKETNSNHSSWLLSEGYHSSFTVPMYDNGQFIGFIFFDSMKPRAFSSIVQRDIKLYVHLITMSIINELCALRSISASVHVAKKFTQLRDFETGAHLERMARYARVIAKEIAPTYNLSDEFIEHIFLFAPLHDIGKIAIPDSILLKPGKFDAEERKIMESHVLKGVELIHSILGEYSLAYLPDSQVLINIVSCHHEFLDGSGYPKALKADEIPIEARIITVADIFDALTSNRPYKTSWSLEDACDELKRMVDNGRLDGACVNALINSIVEVTKIHSQHQDEYA
jgi:HD-GYP domain-containing protein (c-di-GMP phosphodiesterase class II)